MNEYKTLKDKVLRYGYLAPDSVFINYLNDSKDKNYHLYRKLFDDPDIRKKFNKRIENIRRNLIYDNNINMTTINQARPVEGIMPSLEKQNYKDGEEIPLEYVSSKNPLNREGISTVSGSSVFSIVKENKTYFLIAAIVVAGAIGVIYYENHKKIKKHMKSHKK